MGVKAALSKAYAHWVSVQKKKVYQNPVGAQQKEFDKLVAKGRETLFGADHKFEEIEDYESFKARVPIRDYEALQPYIERIKQGEKNVLWPGIPLYFCKTSGTTSGTKYIPLTKDSMPNHLDSARNALLSYIAETGKTDFVSGKMIFLQGSPALDKLSCGIPYGRLSGIVANHVPSYLQANRMPSYSTNCIEDWETKVAAIVEETLPENMSLISGIPSWVQMYFEKVLAKTGAKNVAEVFPGFSLFVFGGVNFGPYKERFEALIGKKIPSIELFPASEGFIAYQDSQVHDGLRLVIDSGIFYEFIPASEFYDEAPTRISLADVKLDVNYVLILNTNAGLWGYNIGDTIRFVSLDPPRIKVTGRIKHYTSAFGEHVIAEEVEAAMSQAIEKFSLKVNEFHVAPQVSPNEGLPYHEWFVEFSASPADLAVVEAYIDALMQAKNIYYKDLIKGHVLRPLKISALQVGSFNRYMESVGKLGGQNKVPRLSNDRKISDFLSRYLLD